MAHKAVRVRLEPHAGSGPSTTDRGCLSTSVKSFVLVQIVYAISGSHSLGRGGIVETYVVLVGYCRIWSLRRHFFDLR